jgi:hypothetical protein
MEYTLKDKLIITKDFLKDLETKSWQEIEHLQNQIANIEDSLENKTLLQLFKNLLTSYYVFIGGLENLDTEAYANTISNKIDDKKEVIPEIKDTADDYLSDLVFDEPTIDKSESVVNDYSEPFEYFVDFDEPIGEPLTDDDLYNN